MFLFSDALVGMYNLSPASAELSSYLLKMHCVMVATVWPLAFTRTNAFRAASDVRFPMVISIFSMWAFRVGLSFVFGSVLHMGVTGVWIAMGCDWTFRAIVFTVHYVRGKWLLKYKG